MTARFSRTAIFAAALVAVACVHSRVLADDVEQVEKANELVRNADQWIGYGCYDKANAILADAEKAIAGVDETGKAEPAAKIKECREKIADNQKNFIVGSYVSMIEREIGGVEGDGSRGLDNSVRVERVNAMLADSWTKAHLDAAKRDELAKKLAWTLKSLESKGNREDMRRLKEWLERLFEEAKGSMPGANSRHGYDSFAGNVEKIEEVLGKDENKKILGAELAKYQKDLADMKAEYAKAMADMRFKDVEEKVAKLQDMLDGKVQVQYWTEFENSLKYADEALAKCPQDDPRAPKLKAKLAEQRKTYESKHAQGDRDEAVTPLIKYWETCKTEYGKDSVGWEQETTPTKLQDYLHHSPSSLGCDKTEKLLTQVVHRWLDGDVKKVMDKYPNDAELKKTYDEAIALRDKASAKVIAFTKSLIDEIEKLPEGRDRKDVKDQFSGFRHTLEYTTKGAPGSAELIARIAAIEKKWEGDVQAAEGAKAALDKKLVDAANAAWPAMLASFKTKKLDGMDALNNNGSWKGTYIHISGGARGVNLNRSGWSYEDQYYFICDIDGVPICGNLDSGLSDAITKVEETTGINRDSDEELVGVIDGTCKVWSLFHYDNGNKSTRDQQVNGVRMRIVALKAVTVCAAVGQGTNLQKLSEFKEVSVSESGSESDGAGGHRGGGGGAAATFFHVIHRFMAWGMCLLLAICGLLAAAHGASKFVPQIQEQKAKLGDYLGYAGAGFAVVGVLWFGAAIVGRVLHMCELGSLPSVAMILAGAFVGTEIARTRGKLKEETAVMIQPAGIVLGLMCLAAVPLHFFFWDWMFL